MVARATALGNYDPSLYFPGAGSGRERGVGGRRAADDCGPDGHGEFADGGG